MDKVLLIGEPMELLLAEEEGALSDVTHFRASVSGAEMNVAVGGLQGSDCVPGS